MPHPTERRRFAPLVWMGSAVAAVLVVLTVNGTLSSWTAAIITNDNDTAGASGQFVALREASGTTACDTTGAADNTATCSTINKYGGDLAMTPGSSSTVDVTFTDPGTAAGATFSYAPGACASVEGAGGVNLCTDGDLTVAVSCSTGATYDGDTVITALTQTAAAPGSLAARNYTASPALAVQTGAITCRFTTTLAANAKPSDAGSRVSQPITWTLSA